MQRSFATWWTDYGPRLDAESLRVVMLAALLAGIADAGAQSPVAASLTGSTGPTLVVAALPIEADPFSLPPEEAIEYFSDLEIVSPEEFAELDSAAQARAWTLAGGLDDYVREAVHGRVQAAVEQGWTANTWLNELESILSGMGVGPTAGRPVHHLRLVYDNALNSANGAGRWLQVQRNADSRPYGQIVTQGDERVRPSHAALDRVMRPMSDEDFWSRYWRPMGHRCRCYVTTLSESQRGVRPITTDDEVRAAYENVGGADLGHRGGMPPPEDPSWHPRAFFAARGEESPL